MLGVAHGSSRGIYAVPPCQNCLPDCEPEAEQEEAKERPKKLTPPPALAQWIALKVMVAEHNRPEDSVTPQDVLAKFRATLDIPPNFRIWIARCGRGGWETGYVRHAATIGTSPIVMPHHRFKTIHSVAFGIGDLFVFSRFTTVPSVPNPFPDEPAALVQIFPNVSSWSWPPRWEPISFLAHARFATYRENSRQGW
jgi:hypothetical protein